MIAAHVAHTFGPIAHFAIDYYSARAQICVIIFKKRLLSEFGAEARRTDLCAIARTRMLWATPVSRACA